MLVGIQEVHYIPLALSVLLIPWAIMLSPAGKEMMWWCATTGCMMCLWDFAPNLIWQQGLKQEEVSLT